MFPERKLNIVSLSETKVKGQDVWDWEGKRVLFKVSESKAKKWIAVVDSGRLSGLLVLLFGCVAQVIYRTQVRKLGSFYLCPLQHIFGIIWHNCIPHVTNLESADVDSIKSIMISHHLQWVGHVIRMPENRLFTTAFVWKAESQTLSSWGDRRKDTETS